VNAELKKAHTHTQTYRQRGNKMLCGGGGPALLGLLDMVKKVHTKSAFKMISLDIK
jgi:hypothetical protein